MNTESIKRRLLVKYPFFGSVVANSNFIAEPGIKATGTDGKNIYYNPNFIESITDDQQIFIFAHEICHIAFDHIFRSEGKDKDLWNIATDSVVNAFLKQDGLPIVEGGVDIPEAINYDAEEMYKKLLEEKKQQQQNSGQDNNNQNNDAKQKKSSNNSFSQNEQSDSESSSNSAQRGTEEQQYRNHDVGHDTHSMWDKTIEKRYKEEQSDSEQSDSKGEDKQILLEKLSKMFDKKKEQQERQNKAQEKKNNEEIKNLIELGEKEAFKQNKIERKKQLEELRKALVSQSHGHGSTTNSERRYITDIGTSKPLIDWRYVLRETIKYDVDWSYRNAVIEDGVVTAYLEEMPRPETEIVLDTSGSIDETFLRNFLRECKNILQTSKVKVGCFDTKFYGFAEIKNVSDIDNLQFYGGGGTDFDVAVNAFTKRVENKIIFTDGDANMTSTPMDVIWIVFGNCKINPAGGKVIYIDERSLEFLYECEAQKQKNGHLR